MDNAHQRLGSCVFSANDILRGQICSLTADEGSALALPRFIRPEDTGEEKSSDKAAAPHRISYSLRRVAPQRCPIWLQF